MSWSIGYDDRWKRDIGWGVSSWCDHPGCGANIDRGLAHVCGGEPYGGDHGCGLYFCDLHLTSIGNLCERCACHPHRKPFKPKPDHPNWIQHKLTDESWQEWRDKNPDEVAKLKQSLLTPTHP